MLLLKPVTMETIAITVATPTTIPRTVRNARNLCARTASRANRMFSPKPRRRWEKIVDIVYSIGERRMANGEWRRGERRSPFARRRSPAPQALLITQRLHRRQLAGPGGRDQARGQTGQSGDADSHHDAA